MTDADPEDIAEEIAAAVRRAERAEAALAEAREHCRMAYRAAEMSAEIMRDNRRTGGWVGAGRTAAQFERIAARAREAFKLCGGEIGAPDQRLPQHAD